MVGMHWWQKSMTALARFSPQARGRWLIISFRLSRYYRRNPRMDPLTGTLTSTGHYITLSTSQLRKPDCFSHCILGLRMQSSCSLSLAFSTPLTTRWETAFLASSSGPSKSLSSTVLSNCWVNCSTSPTTCWCDSCSWRVSAVSSEACWSWHVWSSAAPPVDSCRNCSCCGRGQKQTSTFVVGSMRSSGG